MIGLKRGAVQLSPHNKKWKLLFKKEKKILENQLGDRVIDIQHIGSTSISGIPAKPIIDMSLGLRALRDVQKVMKPLAIMGYELRKAGSDSRQWFFVKGTEENRTHYLHIMRYNGTLWKDDLLFRDYLRAHPKEAKLYAELKKRLADKHADNRGLYTKGKRAFILDMLRTAKNDTELSQPKTKFTD